MVSSAEILQLTSNGLNLPVMEDFYTLQGEGFFQGAAAYFIRLGGCEVGCHWCDVKDSWDFYKWPLNHVAGIVNKAMDFPGRIAVITGGEPTHYNLGPLTHELHSKGFRTHIETSGVFSLTGTWDWICFSPKKFKDPMPEIYKTANELKVIIYNKSDFDWAENFALQVKKDCRLYLQPEWSRKEQMAPLIMQYVKDNPKWRISVQIHKYLNIP